MLRTGQSSALYTCWKYGNACECAILLMLFASTSKVRERAVNVASENVAVRQLAGDIEVHIVVRAFPHYNNFSPLLSSV